MNDIELTLEDIERLTYEKRLEDAEQADRSELERLEELDNLE